MVLAKLFRLEEGDEEIADGAGVPFLFFQKAARVGDEAKSFQIFARAEQNRGKRHRRESHVVRIRRQLRLPMPSTSRKSCSASAMRFGNG